MVSIDRRLLLKAWMLGSGVAAFPAAASMFQARGFTHAVASGEPGPRSVLLWTRYVPESGGSARLSYQVSPSPDFGRIVARGSTRSEAERDHTAAVTARGLEPGRWYYYRFRDDRGRFSPIGRTRTLPIGKLDRFTIGLFSCANLGFGWFNAYAHASARQDLDLIVHVGDYLYEYEAGRYPSARETAAGRLLEPSNELVALADYRLRYAAYRRDPDLQRLHQLFPVISMWDDHETANDSFAEGAENHQPEKEGSWPARKAAAMQAYREWMPVSGEEYREYELGDLATLFRPETRLTGRSRPLSIASALAGVARADVPAALVRFRDTSWQDESRTILGLDQERRLAAGFRQSVARGARWQLLAQQVVMGSFTLPPETQSWLRPGSNAEAVARASVGLASASAGLPFNMDAWDGYPAARRRLLRSALEAEANLVVLSGDSHNAWSFDLDLDGTPAGVEFAGHSVTSPGYEAAVPHVDPAEVEAAVIRRNPQLKWANLGRRGYVTVELRPDRATSQWTFLETIRERSTATAGEHRATALHGPNRLS